MKLTAPIHVLKQQAKAMSRKDQVRLHVALDRIAVREGYGAWSHLARRWQQQDTCKLLYRQLQPGDLVLIGARPGQGKTLLSIGLCIEAMMDGARAAFFTFESTQAEVEQRCMLLGHDMNRFRQLFMLDTSEDISSRHIAASLPTATPGTLVVIDYLQLLDQRRDKPTLDTQVRELKAYADATRSIVVCLSQISRDYEPSTRPYPELRDVRLPNPVELSLFDKACFLANGKLLLQPVI